MCNLVPWGKSSCCKKAKDNFIAESFVRHIYKKTEDKRIIVFDKDYSWRKSFADYPEPIFVVHPRLNDGTWSVATVDKADGSKFERKMYFPESWAGK